MMKRYTFLAVLPVLSVLIGCGGSSAGPTVATPVAVPSAAVSATGAGLLILHPSIYTTWAYSLETPIRINETAGGRARWDYARLSLRLGGREIERSEVGADIIASPPDWSAIGPRHDSSYRIVFRLNSSSFDSVDIVLGFTDTTTGRAFTASVPFGSFSGVDISLVPLARPVGIEPLS